MIAVAVTSGVQNDRMFSIIVTSVLLSLSATTPMVSSSGNPVEKNSVRCTTTGVSFKLEPISKIWEGKNVTSMTITVNKNLTTNVDVNSYTNPNYYSKTVNFKASGAKFEYIYTTSLKDSSGAYVKIYVDLTAMTNATTPIPGLEIRTNQIWCYYSTVITKNSSNTIGGGTNNGGGGASVPSTKAVQMQFQNEHGQPIPPSKSVEIGTQIRIDFKLKPNDPDYAAVLPTSCRIQPDFPILEDSCVNKQWQADFKLSFTYVNETHSFLSLEAVSVGQKSPTLAISCTFNLCVINDASSACQYSAKKCLSRLSAASMTSTAAMSYGSKDGLEKDGLKVVRVTGGANDEEGLKNLLQLHLSRKNSGSFAVTKPPVSQGQVSRTIKLDTSPSDKSPNGGDNISERDLIIILAAVLGSLFFMLCCLGGAFIFCRYFAERMFSGDDGGRRPRRRRRRSSTTTESYYSADEDESEQRRRDQRRRRRHHRSSQPAGRRHSDDSSRQQKRRTTAHQTAFPASLTDTIGHDSGYKYPETGTTMAAGFVHPSGLTVSGGGTNRIPMAVHQQPPAVPSFSSQMISQHQQQQQAEEQQDYLSPLPMLPSLPPPSTTPPLTRSNVALSNQFWEMESRANSQRSLIPHSTSDLKRY